MDASKLKAGDIIAKFIYARAKHAPTSAPPLGYGRVSSVGLTDLNTHLDFILEGKDIIEECVSADQFTDTKEVTLTQIVETFVSCGIQPFTVIFKKADGVIRVLRGIHVSHENLLGRSQVRDFDVTSGSPLRQVDHRTIESLIVGGIKYVVKPTRLSPIDRLGR